MHLSLGIKHTGGAREACWYPYWIYFMWIGQGRKHVLRNGEAIALREQFKSSHEGRVSEYLTQKNYLVLCQEISREKISLVSSAGMGNSNTGRSTLVLWKASHAFAAAEYMGGLLPGSPELGQHWVQVLYQSPALMKSWLEDYTICKLRNHSSVFIFAREFTRVVPC